MKIFGIDKALYRLSAFRNGKKVGTMSVIAFTKLEAYYSCKAYFPIHNGYDYKYLRFAEDFEEVGVILTKNDLKRK